MVTRLTIDNFELSYRLDTLYHNPVCVDSDQNPWYVSSVVPLRYHTPLSDNSPNTLV